MSNIKDIKKNIEKALVKKVAEDFYDASKYIMDDFYTKEPDWYVRTNNLRDGTTMRKVIRNRIGGVEVDSSGVGQHKEASGELVFDLMWNQGIRGLPATGTYKDGSPWVNPHFQTFTAIIPEFGISASSPDAAMNLLIPKWGEVRQSYIDSVVNAELDKFILF